MTWSPAEAEQKLAKVIDALDEVVDDLRQVTFESAVAKHDYEKAEARAFLQYRSTGCAQEEAKRRALLDCEAQHRAHLIAEAVARSQYKVVDVRKTQADGLRSLLVSARGVSS